MQYPDGTPVPCWNEATRVSALTVTPTAADGWLCHNGQAGYASYARPDDAAAIGVSYPAVGLGGVVHGLLKSESSAGVEALHSWTARDGRHFVAGAKTPASEGASIILYNASVVSAPLELSGVEPSFLWSIWHGDAWLVWEFKTATRTYWFQSMVTTPFGSVVPGNLVIEAGGAALEVQLWHTGGYAWGAPAVDPICSVLGPS